MSKLQLFIHKKINKNPKYVEKSVLFFIMLYTEILKFTTKKQLKLIYNFLKVEKIMLSFL